MPYSQLSPGHQLIVPTKHFEDIFDISEEYLTAVISLTKEVATYTKEKLKADGINIIQSSGKAAQQEIYHIHFHVIPRFNGDENNISLNGFKEKINIDEVYKKLTTKNL